MINQWISQLTVRKAILLLVALFAVVYVVWYVIDALDGFDPASRPGMEGGFYAAGSGESFDPNKAKEETPEPEAKKAEAKAEAPAAAPAAKQPAAPQAAAQVQATAVAVTKAAGGSKGVGAGAIQLKAPAAKAVTPARFKQSPFLDGKGLPDVDDRVPSDPLVIEVFDEIGAYGGTMRRVFTGARDTCNYTR